MNKPENTELIRFASLNEAFAYLEQFTNFERRSVEPGEYRLDRMAALLDACGRPQDACPAIHVAGSKGKGSTVHFCAGILKRAGLKVGIYASPHLFDWRERICMPQGFFDDNRYLITISEIRTLVEELPTRNGWIWGEPTTFELLTLCAYLIFRAEAVDWMVVETGLGGRLDATNLMSPMACLITPLELEHTDVLGDTIEQIAREKAGIFRPKTLLLSQKQTPEALAELELAASKLGGSLSPMGSIAVNPVSTAFRWSIQLPNAHEVLDMELDLATKGSFQYGNAELAARCVALLWDRKLLPQIASCQSLGKIIQEGLVSVRISGRLECYQREHMGRHEVIYLDVAHTPRSVANVRDFFQPDSQDALLFGCVSGKLYQEMAEILAPAFGQVIISTPGTFKQSNPPAVHSAFLNYNRASRLILDPFEAFESLLNWLEQHPQGGRGLVCGSFYMAGEILPLLLKSGFVPN